MKDLKQLWVIKINPENVKEENNNIYMNEKSVEVKQLGHFINEESDSYGKYKMLKHYIDFLILIYQEIK